jgi:hypothetical protein
MVSQLDIRSNLTTQLHGFTLKTWRPFTVSSYLIQIPLLCVYWLKMASAVLGITLHKEAQCSPRISKFMLTDICLVFMSYCVRSDRLSAQRGSPLCCAMRSEIVWMCSPTTPDVLLTVLFCSCEQMVGWLVAPIPSSTLWIKAEKYLVNITKLVIRDKD